MPPISVFRCYLKVFAKMATEIIIPYRELLQRDLLATFCFIKIDFIMKQCGKKQLHCISQKIPLTGVDSDIKGLLDYVMHYIIKYMYILFIEASNVSIKTCITSLVAKRSCQLSYTMVFLLIIYPKVSSILQHKSCCSNLRP